MLEFAAILSFVAFALLVAWVYRLNARRSRRLETFAQEAGLAYDGDAGAYGTVYGKVHELDYEVAIEPVRERPRSSKYALVCRADLRRLVPRDLSMTPRAFPGRDLDPLDVGGVEIGDDDFDRSFVVDASDTEEARELLGRRRVVDALLSLSSSDTAVHLYDGRLEMLVDSIPTSVADVRRHSDRFARCLDRLTDALQGSAREDVEPRGW